MSALKRLIRIVSVLVILVAVAATANREAFAQQRSAGEPAAEIWVAPTGKPDAPGTADAPLDLQTVLNGPAWLKPGTTAWMLGGKYSGVFTQGPECSGTKERPLVFRVAQGARATIIGGLQIHGKHARFMGFEVTNPNLVESRFADYDESDDVGLVNLILHDNGVHDVGHNGISCFSQAKNSEIYGCLIYNVGKGTRAASPNAHGIYTQNIKAAGMKRIEDNVFFRVAGFGIHAYGSSKAPVEAFTIKRNVLFRQGSYGALVGGGGPATDIVFDENYFYGNASTTCCLGWGGRPNTGLAARRNYFVGKFPLLELRKWADATVRDNTFVAPQGGPLISVSAPPNAPLPPYAWDANTYYRGPATPEEFAQVNEGAPKTADFDAWRKRGFDAQAKAISGVPKENHIFVLPNRYQPGRGHVVIYNWTGVKSVALDLAGVLIKEKRYVVLDVQDYYGTPLAAGTWMEGPVTVPLPERDPAPAFATLVVLSGEAIDYSGRGEEKK